MSDWGNIAQWVALAISAFALLRTVYSDNKKAETSRVSRIEEEQTKIDDRVTRIEGEMNHLPDREMVHRMELSLSELKGDFKALNQRLVSMAATSERLQEFLLENKK